MKNKFFLLMLLGFLLIVIGISNISSYTIYNSSAGPNVVFRSIGLNSQVTTTFNINFSEVDITGTAITFYDLTYVHPLSCIAIEYLPVYSIYGIVNYNITTDDFPYTDCSSIPGEGGGSGTAINNSNFSQFGIILTYDKDWLFNVENKIKLEVYNITNKSVNVSFIKVFVNNLNSSQVLQFVSYNYTTEIGTYIFKYTIPLQNITGVVFTFQVNKDGYNIIKTVTINISDGNGKAIISNVPNTLFIIAVIGLLIIVISFLYWKYRRKNV